MSQKNIYTNDSNNHHNHSIPQNIKHKQDTSFIKQQGYNHMHF